ncbi:hypothetical protein OE88DRAFT_1649871 [Heliocybe sulcata]|uniref:Uncharacterized protein n=1 Tax=Heliocybe sulcata TaxID=5364 RepID=A0A5C3NJ83_9AGAM|nr:hypothetical protein OE88DRAFT_1649871 [Heliocybe sulcata]
MRTGAIVLISGSNGTSQATARLAAKLTAFLCVSSLHPAPMGEDGRLGSYPSTRIKMNTVKRPLRGFRSVFVADDETRVI